MEHTAKEHVKKPRFVRWAVMVGIVVALNLFFFAARSLVMPMPQYNDYCPVTTSAPQDSQSCSTAGGVWTDTSGAEAPTAPGSKAMPPAPTGYCDMQAKCQPIYQKAYDQFQLYSFVLEVGLGVLAIIVGVLPLGSSIVSTGLTYGGVIAFIVASGQYWSDASSWLRLAISLIALAALIYIGVRRFRD